MVPQLAWKRIRWTGMATLVLLVSAAIAPARVKAGCGDYVTVGGRHTAHHFNADRLDADTPAIPRCHGPQCSDNSNPPAAPAPKIEVTVERWAIAWGARLTVLPNHDALLADAHKSPCDGFGLSILRPPR